LQKRSLTPSAARRCAAPQRREAGSGDGGESWQDSTPTGSTRTGGAPMIEGAEGRWRRARAWGRRSHRRAAPLVAGEVCAVTRLPVRAGCRPTRVRQGKAGHDGAREAPIFQVVASGRRAYDYRLGCSIGMRAEVERMREEAGPLTGPIRSQPGFGPREHGDREA